MVRKASATGAASVAGDGDVDVADGLAAAAQGAGIRDFLDFLSLDRWSILSAMGGPDPAADAPALRGQGDGRLILSAGLLAQRGR